MTANASSLSSSTDAGNYQAFLTFAGVAAFLRRRAGGICALALVLFAVSVIVITVWPTRYMATALVFVDPRDLRITPDPDVLPGVGQDAAAVQSLAEVANSDGFLGPLVARLGIDRDEDISEGEKQPEKILERFRKRLDIARRGLTYVIAFSVTAASPDKAARYANGIAEAFVASQAQARTRAAEEASTWLASRLRTLSEQVKSAEDAVAAFKAEHNIINAGRESTTRQLKVSELSQQVAQTRLLAEEAKARYEQAQRNLGANVETPTSGRDVLSSLKSQRTQLNDQIAQKRAMLGDRHPDLVIANHQLKELNQQIEDERRRNVGTLQSEYESLGRQRKALEQQLGTLERAMADEVRDSVRLQELQRSAEASRNIYEQFLSRSKSTNEQRQFQTSQVRIASIATPPARPTRPPLPVLYSGAAAASILLAILLTAGLDIALQPSAFGATGDSPARDHTVSTEPHPPAAEANPPVWAHVPHLRRSRSGAPDFGPDAGLHLGALMDVIIDGGRHRGVVVLVTSSRPHCGCSTVARAIQSEARKFGLLSALVALVPSGASAMAPTAEGHEAIRADLAAVAAMLSGRDGAAGTLSDVRNDADLLVLDAAKGSADETALAALSAMSDLTVLVVAESEVSVAAVARATKSLSRFAVPRLGLVINNPAPWRVQDNAAFRAPARQAEVA